MSGINKVIIVGNLGRDPELRATAKGSSVCNLNIAVTERIKQGDEWKDATEWFRVVCFGKMAETAGKYLAKGRQVYIEGRLQTKKYKDKDGAERTSTEVLAETVQFLGGGQGGKSTSMPEATAERSVAKAPSLSNDEMMDDLPF